MKIKKYLKFIKEDLSNEINLSDELKDIKTDLIEMIEKVSEKPSLENLKKHLTDYISDPDETPIEGLINDSDVYEFYLKWRNDIDGMLTKLDFYDKVPSKNEIFSLYDYVVFGTKSAVKEISSKILEDMEGKSEEESPKEEGPQVQM